ncbi:MAG: 1,4-dihydroxy-2-naphthoate polyprenyltransferase [Actinomycetota bacterium]
MSATLWVEAARPKTLGASVVPVLVGTAASGRLIAWRFAAALIVSVSLQVAVNFANDYFDAVKGVDTPDRKGPRRLTASGLISPSRMKLAIFLAVSVACLAGLALAVKVDLRLAVVGVFCVLAALSYSGGPRPYGSAAMGEIFVFVFFGLVATIGSAYIQTKSFSLAAAAAAIPVGLLATALLVVNNLRDIDTDGQAGKATLAVKLGRERTIRLFINLIVAAFVSLALVVTVGGGWPVLAALLAVPLARPAVAGVETSVGPGLIKVLVATSKLDLAFGILLASGLWVGQML